MKQFINYSVILMTLFFIAFSCSDEYLFTKYPPSPVNIPNAITFNPELKYDTVSDIDGNIYKTITIGKHTWMAENLRVTRFRNGDKIPYIPQNKDWASDDIFVNDDRNLGLCAYNNNNNRDSIAKYGLLYGVLAIKDNRCIAPLGWHIATIAEWYEIIGSSQFGVDTIFTFRGFDWVSSIVTNKTTINKTGLTLLPAGCRSNDGSFSGRGNSVLVYPMSYSNSYISFDEYTFQNPSGQLWRLSVGGSIGYPVRCVKDE